MRKEKKKTEELEFGIGNAEKKKVECPIFLFSAFRIPHSNLSLLINLDDHQLL